MGGGRGWLGFRSPRSSALRRGARARSGAARAALNSNFPPATCARARAAALPAARLRRRACAMMHHCAQLSEEECLPYERPALSKGYLLGKVPRPPGEKSVNLSKRSQQPPRGRTTGSPRAGRRVQHTQRVCLTRSFHEPLRFWSRPHLYRARDRRRARR